MITDLLAPVDYIVVSVIYTSPLKTTTRNSKKKLPRITILNPLMSIAMVVGEIFPRYGVLNGRKAAKPAR